MPPSITAKHRREGLRAVPGSFLRPPRGCSFIDLGACDDWRATISRRSGRAAVDRAAPWTRVCAAQILGMLPASSSLPTGYCIPSSNLVIGRSGSVSRRRCVLHRGDRRCVRALQPGEEDGGASVRFCTDGD
jgi:hypothetical protein